MGKVQKTLNREELAAVFSNSLLSHLAAVQTEIGGELYLTGGTVRDLLLGRAPVDIDLTVSSGARNWAANLATATGGAYVPLGRNEDAARVVFGRQVVDFSSFREGASTLTEELFKRDITINGLGVHITPLLSGQVPDQLSVVDPCGGLEDLAGGIIRAIAETAILNDPLRMIRVFRFGASLGFSLDPVTLGLVNKWHHLLVDVAAERILHEFETTLSASQAFPYLLAMVESGLFWDILPELQPGVGLAQPGSHHLDVFDHNLETFNQMEGLLASSLDFFTGSAEWLEEYCSDPRCSIRLKWAALLHDIGKAETWAVHEEKGGRITFYNHDQHGVELIADIANRLRFSNEDKSVISRLVGGHMRPFHLANVARSSTLSVKACIRLVKSIEPDLPGLFLLGMADSLAGQGEDRPEAMEEELKELFSRLVTVQRENMTPIRTAPPLLTGNDLIEQFQLEPGPIFKEILSAVEEARMEQTLVSYDEALRLAASLIPGRGAASGCQEE